MRERARVTSFKSSGRGGDSSRCRGGKEVPTGLRARIYQTPQARRHLALHTEHRCRPGRRSRPSLLRTTSSRYHLRMRYSSSTRRRINAWAVKHHGQRSAYSVGLSLRRIVLTGDRLASPHYFKTCKISAVALIKMVCAITVSAREAYRIRSLPQVIHARSGVPHEIMGMMQGKVVGTSLVVVDSFALPVQGTETRVNAANEANEYMVQYMESSNRVRRHFTFLSCLGRNLHIQVARLEHAVGWYHSHPGYGCWLSGIDVNTQMTNQKFQDPFVAVVVCLLLHCVTCFD